VTMSVEKKGDFGDETRILEERWQRKVASRSCKLGKPWPHKHGGAGERGTRVIHSGARRAGHCAFIGVRNTLDHRAGLIVS
jgi:hypothetical protein